MRVLVLDVSLDDTASLDAFADALVAAGTALGAPFAHAGADAHATAEAQRFTHPSGVTVELVDDHDARVRYVEVLGDATAAAQVRGVLRDALPVVTLDRLLEEADAVLDAGLETGFDTASAALLRLALGTPLPPPLPVVHAVAHGLAHARPEVRLAAVEAVGLIGLPPFLDAMHRMRTDDPDAYVRGYAEQTVRMLHG